MTLGAWVQEGSSAPRWQWTSAREPAGTALHPSLSCGSTLLCRSGGCRSGNRGRRHRASPGSSHWRALRRPGRLFRHAAVFHALKLRRVLKLLPTDVQPQHELLVLIPADAKRLPRHCDIALRDAEEAAHADYHGLELPIRVEEDIVDLAQRLVLAIVDRGAEEGAGEHLLGLLHVDEAKLTGGTRAVGAAAVGAGGGARGVVGMGAVGCSPVEGAAGGVFCASTGAASRAASAVAICNSLRMTTS